MIRTAIADDDFMAVDVHRQFVERLDGFLTVGTANTGAETLQLVAAEQPDLLLLDIYLPDISGIEVLHQIRAVRRAPVDVIVITSAKHVDMLRDAMHLGVTHYIIKPFTFSTFRERLESYATARNRLARMEHVGQRDIDRLYGVLRSSGSNSLPKHISAPTLARVTGIVRDSQEPISAAEIAERTGLSEGIARRYLRHLCDTGAVDYVLRYGVTGRPEHLYRWDSASSN